MPLYRSEGVGAITIAPPRAHLTLPLELEEGEEVEEKQFSGRQVFV
jgi:hypothetical protein